MKYKKLENGIIEYKSKKYMPLQYNLKEYMSYFSVKNTHQELENIIHWLKIMANCLIVDYFYSTLNLKFLVPLDKYKVVFDFFNFKD